MENIDILNGYYFMSNQLNVALVCIGNLQKKTFPNFWIVVSMLSDCHEG